jgi:hypothetical protein
MVEVLLKFIKESLLAINHPRFFETERGFQGAFIAELSRRLPELQFEGAIIEQEYQKRIRSHGIRIRPDIIIHVPFEDGRHNSRRDGNFVVFELKLKAGPEEALTDFNHLSSMCEILGYPMGIFINIDSNNTHLNIYNGSHKQKLHAFAVSLQGTKVEIQHEFER